MSARELPSFRRDPDNPKIVSVECERCHVGHRILDDNLIGMLEECERRWPNTRTVLGLDLSQLPAGIDWTMPALPEEIVRAVDTCVRTVERKLQPPV